MRRRSFLKLVGAGVALAVIPTQLSSLAETPIATFPAFTFRSRAKGHAGTLLGFHAGDCWSGWVSVPDDGEWHDLSVTTSPFHIAALIDGSSVPIQRASFNDQGWKLGKFGLSIYNPNHRSFGYFRNTLVVTGA